MPSLNDTTNKLKRPDGIVIYVPGNHDACITGLHLNKGKRSWSAWQYIPTAEVNDFVNGFLESGWSVTDLRTLANMKLPGMGQATPILIAAPGVSIKDVALAAAELHQAILDSPDETIGGEA